jgi:hypothetical protein
MAVNAYVFMEARTYILAGAAARLPCQCMIIYIEAITVVALLERYHDNVRTSHQESTSPKATY